MKMTFRWYGEKDTIPLSYIRQIPGMTGVVPAVYVNLFNNKRFNSEKLLKITIPESLEYSEVFSDTFSSYLKTNELVEVKTTGMGSLFRLSYRIELKDIKEEKQFIDELRTKNGNLEISILPYVSEGKTL